MLGKIRGYKAVFIPAATQDEEQQRHNTIPYFSHLEQARRWVMMRMQQKGDVAKIFSIREVLEETLEFDPEKLVKVEESS